MEKAAIRIGEVIGIVLIFFGTSISPGLLAGTGRAISEQSTELSTDWWPMFHHDLTHSGFSTSVGPSTNDVAWTYQTDMLILASPVVADGKVYIGSNHVYDCLDAQSGAQIWNYTTDGWAEGNAAVDNDSVYVVSRNQEGQGENRIICLTADTGQFVWNYTDCFWPFSPVVSNGMVYFGSLDGYVRCLDALDGSLIWSFSTGYEGDINSPAISDGKAYFGSDNGQMYCVDALTGGFIWNYSTNGKIMECPTIADGKVYFGSCDWNVYCLDAQTGEFIWKYLTSFYVDSTPAVANGKIYIGSRDCNIYCLDAENGGLIWIYSANDEVDSSPAIADGKVYVGSDDGNVYCFDADNGVKLWQYATGSYVMSSPAIAMGKVYIGSYDTNLYCFGGALTASFTWTPVDPSHNQTVTLNATESYDPNGYNITSYEWDWTNDGTYDESSANPIVDHVWSDPGTYQVKLRVTNSNNQTATVTRTIRIENAAPTAPVITGQTGGKKGKSYEYTFAVTDPENDQCFLFIDWGDSSNSGWIGPYHSNEVVNESHTWTSKGGYNITAKAKDPFGAESDWGVLQITMPYQPSYVRFFAWLFERFPHSFPLLRQLLGY